jgi:hypothetical protein
VTTSARTYTTLRDSIRPGLHPEADFTEFDGHGIEIDAVDAAADDVAECGLVVFRAEGRKRDTARSLRGAPCLFCRG